MKQKRGNRLETLSGVGTAPGQTKDDANTKRKWDFLEQAGNNAVVIYVPHVALL